MTTTSKSRKGIIAELKAAAHFIKKGFHVAKSLNPQCPFDLVITDNKGNCCLIDVKSKSIRKTDTYGCKKGTSINRSLNKKQKAMGVEIYIYDETK
jgi:hypothetical protein